MNKESLYLHRLEIVDFRTFGHFALNLPPGPGVTILWGCNGLGKSNFFAALEWGLTNKVERLWEAKGTDEQKFAALRRDGTGQPSVKLSFTDGSVIERKEDSVTPEGFERLLMNEGWPTTEFATALRFTHILGQSADQHIVRMDDTKRWTYLGPITRLKEVWDIQKKLGGQFTRELNRLIEQAAQEIASAKVERDRFLELREQRDRLRDLARAAQAVSPEQAGMAVVDIMRQLRTVYGLDWPLSSSMNVPDLLADQGLAIQKCFELWRSHRAGLDLKYADIERNMKVLAAIADLTTSLKVIVLERESQLAHIETLKSDTVQFTYERNAAKEKHELVSERFSQLDSLRTLEQQSTENIRKHQVLLTKLSEIRDRRQAAIAETEPVRVALASSEDAAKEAFEANNKLSQVAILATQLKTLEEAERDYQAKEKAWKETQGKIIESREQLIILSDRMNVLAAERAEVIARLTFIRSRTDAIHGAVATIAEALSDEICECPVCCTHHNPGALKELARTAIAKSNPQLAEIEADLAKRETEIVQLSEKRARVEEECKQYDRIRYSSEQAREEVERQVHRLKAEPKFAGAAREALSAVVSKLMASAQTEADVALARVKDIGNVETWRSILQNRLERLECLDREEADARAAVERVETMATDITSRITSLCNALGLTAEWRTTLADTIVSAVQDVDLSNAALHETETKLSSVAESMQEVTERLKETEYRRGQIEAEVQARQAELTLIQDSWKRSGLKYPIGTETLKNAIDRAEKHLAELTVMRVQHEELLAGLAAWTSADELKRCEESISNWLVRKDCEGEDELAEVLAEDILAKEKLSDDLADIERQRDNVRTIVREQNRRIQEVTLQPLNGLLNAFTSALVTQQSHEIRLDCRFGIGAGTGILAKDIRGNQVNPELYLSEGQLGGVNLALLLGANLTYPWSRWPAMMIDDPLQYSDIISSSAFMDLICNLVQERKLQVIITTHDSSEADFCRRKCVAAGIPIQDCQLLANSQDGVQYRSSW